MPLFQMRFRRDTTANWQAANPILLDGEVGYERTENGLLLTKMGDGVMGADGIITGTSWNDLPYVSGPAGPAPEHEWQETSLRFRNPDGSWGETVQLKGAIGPIGPEGPPGPEGTSTPATKAKLGGVIVGEGLDVDEDGCLSVDNKPVTLATPDAPGIVQVGAGLEVTLPTEAAEGEEAPTPGILSLRAHASETPDAYGKGDFQFYGHVKLTDNFEEETAAKDGVAISAKGVKDAWDRLLNLQSEVVITSSGNWTAPETATYAVTCIGGGGKGGNGSTGVASSWSACRWGSDSVERYGRYINHGGNGGGGGGAGQTITQNVTLTKGDIIPVTIGGGDGGSTEFGEHLTALGGGTGGNGVAPTYVGHSPSNCHDGPGSFSGGPGSGGAAGFSYGSSPSAGGVGGGGSASWGGSTSGSLGYVSGGNGGAGGTSTHGSYGNGGTGGNGAPVNKASVGSASGGGNGTQGAVIIVISALST